MVNEFEYIDILVNRVSIAAESDYESMISVNYVSSKWWMGLQENWQCQFAFGFM